MRWTLASVTLLGCLATVSWGAEENGSGRKSKESNRAALEKQFAERMSGATLVGHFTDTTKQKSVSPKEEKYTLLEVRKLEGDYWLFKARIQYGEHDATVPLSLPVEWAGDTPVITLTDLAIPGFGTFTARVLFYDDHYAGTWSGANHGGHLFGKVVRDKQQE